MDTNILLESGTNELEILEFALGNNHYGINVAKLAGLPTDVITRASEILSTYENTETDRKEISVQTSLPLDFITQKSEIEEILRNTNILELSPIKALNLLYELKEKLK